MLMLVQALAESRYRAF